jgi:hypothetical protein
MCVSTRRSAQYPCVSFDQDWNNRDTQHPYPGTMSSMVYTAQHVGTDDNTPPIFRLKGLSQMVPSRPTELDIHGIAFKHQVAFSQYARNIAYFVAATDHRQRKRVDGRPIGVPPANVRMLPFPAPPVNFALLKDLPHQSVDRFLASLGPSASSEVKGKTRIFTLRSPPSNALLEKLFIIASKDTNCGPDSVNLRGYQSYRLLSGFINSFLCTHTYAAKYPIDPTESVTRIATLDTGHTSGFDTELQSYYTFDDDDDDDNTPHQGVQGSEVHPPATPQSGEAMEQDQPPATPRAPPPPKYTGDYSIRANELLNGDLDDDDRAEILDNSMHTSMSAIAGIDSVVWAKPSPVKSSDINIGPTASVPNEPGILFPYFKGLVTADNNWLRSFVCRRFFLYLGETTAECQRNYVDFRKGISSLGNTPQGMEMAHMIIGIELALETQGRCYLLSNLNSYDGFVILGTQFCVFDTKKWVAPGEEELINALADMDPHMRAARSLTRLMVSWKAAGSYTGEILNEEGFDSPEIVFEQLSKLDISKLSKEDIKEGDLLVRALNYAGDGFRPMDPMIVAEAFQQYFSTDPVPLRAPTFFPNLSIFRESRAFNVLSRFGPEAPSLWNDRGSIYKCLPVRLASVESSRKRKKTDEVDNYANMPEKILITPKPLHIAVQDVAKMEKNSAIKIDLKERARGSRNITVSADVSRKRLWDVLIEGLSSEESVAKRVKTDASVIAANYDDVLASFIGA